MNITKQYSKPSCILTLEGFDENAETIEDNLNPENQRISILTGAECYFISSNQRLSGGRDFLENLAHAVNSYAQEFLSGITHSQGDRTEYPQVHIASVPSEETHLISLEPNPQEGESKQEINLKTVELFDLVDIIDRFYADETTLPDVAHNLEVVSKRLRQPEEPFARRVVPFAIGTISLAVLAGFFFVLPVREIREPEPIETIPTEPIPTAPGENTETTEPEESTEE